MGILFMAAKSETDRKQLLFFLDEASHSKDTHTLIQKRKSHSQSDRASGAIIEKANRLASNFDPGRLKQTPSVYQLLDFYAKKTIRDQAQYNDRDVLFEYKLKNFNKESLSMQSQKKNEHDFKWLERYRNYIVISLHLQSLDEFRTQQLDLLLSINQKQDIKKYDLTEGQIYFNYLHQQANALWKFTESLLNMNYHEILQKKIKLYGRDLQKWSFDKQINQAQEVFIKSQIDSFRSRDQNIASFSTCGKLIDKRVTSYSSSSFSYLQRHNSYSSSIKICQLQDEQESAFEKKNQKTPSTNSDKAFDERGSLQFSQNPQRGFELPYDLKSQQSKSKDRTYSDLNAPFSDEQQQYEDQSLA